ncbi:UpxY family transcription antiterminator [Mucilaginibacter sp. RCC_168]|uniref:UpxY family transcription antiterminator n=1 Tax=Mucilaginibacter sp. RCC_168 TaxID=3239221 RepID=UPI0035269D21
MGLLTSEVKNKWYPVYTHAKAEKKAYEALTSKGILTYLPLHRQLRQWSDRKKWVEEPFIKSYIFVNIAERAQADVLMTRGISRFLYFSGKPATMPDSQINELKLLMTSSIDLEITEEDLQPGEKIIIKAGPLKGMTGEVVIYQSRKQLILRLESIGRSIIVHVAASYIERF